MVESYTSVGFAFPLTATLTLWTVPVSVLQGRSGKQLSSFAKVCVWALPTLMFSFALLHLPAMWACGALFLLLSASMFSKARKSSNPKACWVFGVALILIGFLTAYGSMRMSARDGFILRDDVAVFRDGAIPRSQLHFVRGYNFWSLETNPGPGFRQGPFADSLAVFWGPGGIMSGAQVGQRLEEWAQGHPKSLALN